MNRRSFFAGLAAGFANLFAPSPRTPQLPKRFGEFPLRTELTILSADDPKARTIGFSCFENVGIGAFNPRGLTRLKVDREG